jgi:NADH-quinone oxidoreductase subunit M
VILVLALVGILYGALVAMVQEDVKRLVAYSSVSHLGFVMLGLFSLNLEAFQGSLYQMLNHGLSTGALFLLVGIIYQRRHTRMIVDYGGIARTVPLYAAAFLFITLSSIGLPGLNGFVGEFLILLGAFGSNTWTGVVGGLGVILGAFYMLWLCQRFLFGPIRHEENRGLRDLNLREGLTLVPIVIFAVVLGVAPRPLLKRMEPSLADALQRITSAAATEEPAPRAELDGTPAGLRGHTRPGDPGIERIREDEARTGATEDPLLPPASNRPEEGSAGGETS